MKKAGIVVAALLCVALACGTFYYVKQKSDNSLEQDAELTDIQKLITKDITTNYPATPREVVKLFNQIILCYYGDDYTEKELEQLVEQELLLFDEELLAENPKEEYFASVKQEIKDYKDASKTIYQSSVCDSNDVVYKTINGEDIACVSASYFLKEGKSFNRTYQEFLLRKDADGNWKILGFYQVEGNSSENK